MNVHKDNLVSDEDFLTVVKLILSSITSAENYISYEESLDIYTIKVEYMETNFFFSLYRYKGLVSKFSIFYATKQYFMLDYTNLESNIISEVLEKMLGFKQKFS